MLMQRNLPRHLDQVASGGAAVQRSFPDAVIQNPKICRNPNRSFAALVADASHADEVAFGDGEGMRYGSLVPIKRCDSLIALLPIAREMQK